MHYPSFQVYPSGIIEFLSKLWNIGNTAWKQAILVCLYTTSRLKSVTASFVPDFEYHCRYSSRLQSFCLPSCLLLNNILQYQLFKFFLTMMASKKKNTNQNNAKRADSESSLSFEDQSQGVDRDLKVNISIDQEMKTALKNSGLVGTLEV